MIGEPLAILVIADAQDQGVRTNCSGLGRAKRNRNHTPHTMAIEHRSGHGVGRASSRGPYIGRMHTSPLDDRHRALGAKFAESGGWQRPLEYHSAGVLT